MCLIHLPLSLLQSQDKSILLGMIKYISSSMATSGEVLTYSSKK